jgi:hypothetical protein
MSKSDRDTQLPPIAADFKFPSAAELGVNFDKISVAELCEALAKSGVRKGPEFSDWADLRLRLVDEFGISGDVEKLIKLGITRETLAVAIFVINLAPAMDHFFKEMLGSKRARMRDVKSLTKAAEILRRIGSVLPEMPEMILGIPGVPLTAKAVDHHATMLIWGEVIYSFLGANSVLEVAKYALAGFVKRAIGRFHDREVSALTGAALQKSDYDETAHRVWRIRAYPRLEKSVPIAPRLLQAFNSVLSQP